MLANAWLFGVLAIRGSFSRVEEVADVIVADLRTEDEIQREAVEWVTVNRAHLESGTSAWQVEVEQQRERFAIRRGYTLP